MDTSNGIHRGGYKNRKDNRVCVLTQYFQDHQGIPISKTTICRETGLTLSQIRNAIETLSFIDPRLTEDDQGNLFYLP